MPSRVPCHCKGQGLVFRVTWLGIVFRKTDGEGKQGAIPSSFSGFQPHVQQEMGNGALKYRFQHHKVDYRNVSLRLTDHLLTNFTGNC